MISICSKTFVFQYSKLAQVSNNFLQILYKIITAVTLPLSSMSLPRAAIVSNNSETSTSSVTMPTKIQFSPVPNSGPGERKGRNKSRCCLDKYCKSHWQQAYQILRSWKDTNQMKRWYQCPALVVSLAAQYLISPVPVSFWRHPFLQTVAHTWTATHPS